MRPRIVLASNNRGKLDELQRMLEPLGYELVCQAALGIPEAPEPHRTFVENALAKARNAAAHSGLPALADDAGLCVDAFGGLPVGPGAGDGDRGGSGGGCSVAAAGLPEPGIG